MLYILLHKAIYRNDFHYLRCNNLENYIIIEPRIKEIIKYLLVCAYFSLAFDVLLFSFFIFCSHIIILCLNILPNLN